MLPRQRVSNLHCGIQSNRFPPSVDGNKFDGLEPRHTRHQFRESFGNRIRSLEITKCLYGNEHSRCYARALQRVRAFENQVIRIKVIKQERIAAATLFRTYEALADFKSPEAAAQPSEEKECEQNGQAEFPCRPDGFLPIKKVPSPVGHGLAICHETKSESLPTTTEGSIQLDDGQQDIAAKLCFDKFALKQISFGIENLQIAIEAALIANDRQAIRFP